MFLALFLAAAQPSPVPAQPSAQPPSWTVADFIRRAQELMLRGEAAVGTPEMQALREQVTAAGQTIRARQQAEQASGAPRTLCIPERGEASNDLITHLMALPADRQTMPFVEGFAGYVRSKYPCPAAG